MSKQTSQGVIKNDNSDRRTDYLYRISIKCLIINENGDVLVVKEAGRTSWDLPGGGMDHGEDIMTTIARELAEEINLTGNFSYQIIDVDEPSYVATHDWWQIRLVFALVPKIMLFSAGEDGDAIAFMSTADFKSSESEVERRIDRYVRLLANK